MRTIEYVIHVIKNYIDDEDKIEISVEEDYEDEEKTLAIWIYSKCSDYEMYNKLKEIDSKLSDILKNYGFEYGKDLIVLGIPERRTRLITITVSDEFLEEDYIGKKLRELNVDEEEIKNVKNWISRIVDSEWGKISGKLQKLSEDERKEYKAFLKNILFEILRREKELE